MHSQCSGLPTPHRSHTYTVGMVPQGVQVLKSGEVVYVQASPEQVVATPKGNGTVTATVKVCLLYIVYVSHCS